MLIWGRSMQVVAAFIVDLLVGDPGFLTHPVVLMGRLISWGEKRLWDGNQGPTRQKLAGMLLVVGMLTITYSTGHALVLNATHIHEALGMLLSIWLISTTIAAKGLWSEASRIEQLLKVDNLLEARKAVGRIVGRDVNTLDQADVIRAAVESVAENTVDAVIAPLFYAILGGAPLALAYRMINTLDSMVGYRNERYVDFGWAAARLDDIANYVPARLTGLLITAGATLWCLDAKHSWRILWRDGRKHPSPNSGISEAAVAGALRIQLGGESRYQGSVSRRPYLGDPHLDLVPSHIRQAMWLMLTSGFLMVFIIWGVSVLI
ncbi:MAG: cobalamin biosynthesis protein CobD [Firmicutes bacterium]|nr:cobalamin biosynthesis protein CobD [Bacillota bacterium]